jgi:lipoprotein signal peptidase
VFNVADAAIVCGVAVLVLESLFSKRRHGADQVST